MDTRYFETRLKMKHPDRHPVPRMMLLYMAVFGVYVVGEYPRSKKLHYLHFPIDAPDIMS